MLAPMQARARRIEVYHDGQSKTVVAVDEVGLSKTAATLNAGDTLRLTANVAPESATNKAIAWTSSNTAVATVSSVGLVTAVAVGTAAITATSKAVKWAVDTAADGNSAIYVTDRNGDIVPVKVIIYNADGTTTVLSGSYTLTTVEGGGVTATCAIAVANLPPHMTLDGITWASVNVDDFQTFALCPDMYTKFYQWNRSTAWNATGSVTGWTETEITDPAWTINPCPAGWRLPTWEEQFALQKAGSTWANANAKGNAVAGMFYGPRHASCSLPDNMTSCIFLPAVGYRVSGILFNQGSRGKYGSSTQNSATYYTHLSFDTSNSPYFTASVKAEGFNIRCVR